MATRKTVDVSTGEIKEYPIQPVFLRTPHNYDRNAASDETGISCPEETMAKQAFKDECDINTIVRRFGITGQLPKGVRMPTFGDFSEVTDFASAMNAIALANEAFDTMPAEIRTRFQNDPQKFLEFTSNDANYTEAEKMGLVKAKSLSGGSETAKSGPGATITPPGDTKPAPAANAASQGPKGP